MNNLNKHVHPYTISDSHVCKRKYSERRFLVLYDMPLSSVVRRKVAAATVVFSKK